MRGEAEEGWEEEGTLCTVRPVWSRRSPPPTWYEGLGIVAGDRERTEVQMGKETSPFDSMARSRAVARVGVLDPSVTQFVALL